MKRRATSPRPLRVGLVGCGSVALAAHIPAFLELPEDYRVVAVADPTPALRVRARELLRLSNDDAYASHQDLLARPDVDMIDVCTPPHVRCAIVTEAAGAGKHIVSEKPLATVPKEAREMVRAVRKAGVTLGLMHNYLYLPEFVAARAIIRSGEIGRAEVAILNYLGVLDNPGSIDYQPGWRRRSDVAGGGVLMDMLHVVYVAEDLLGEPIRRVSAYLEATRAGSPVEELALCRFETETKVALVNIGWGFGPGGVQVSGTEGRLIIRYQQDGTSPFYPFESILVAGTSGERTMDRLEQVRIDHRLALAALARAVRTGADPDASGEDGWRTLEAVLAAYESAVVDRAVSLPLSEEDPVFHAGTAGLAELAASSESRAVSRGIFGLKHPDGRAELVSSSATVEV